KVAIAYIRASTGRQHLGPEAQRHAIEAWATREGVHVAAWHEDLGVSGKTPLERRPGLMAALASVTEHRAGLLVVVKRDRLARDNEVMPVAEAALARAGARVVTPTGEGEGDDPASVLMRRMIDAIGE